MRRPVVSVIMPTYNRADMIGGAIESMLKQTFADFELIIVNDGSTDATDIEILSRVDSRVRYYLLGHGHDYGIGALNFGLEKATGDYLTFISSDNMYFSEYLRQLIDVLDGGADFAYGSFLELNRPNGILSEFKRPAHLSGDFELWHLAIGYTIGICFLFTREIWEKSKPYRPGPHSDYDMTARMAISGARLERINSMLGVNVVHPGQLSATSQQKGDETSIRLMVCEHLKKINHPGASELERKVMGYAEGDGQ